MTAAWSSSAARLGVGVIGCGRAATTWHLPALGDVEGAAVVGVADIDGARLTSVAQRFGVDRSTTDYRELLDDPAVEAVAVCVPVGDHAEIVSAALEADKHVLVEKPLSLSLHDCDAIVADAAASPRTVAVGFNLRMHRLVRRARAILRAGSIGEPRLVRSVFTSPSRFRPDDPEWRWARRLGGGVLIEQAIHHLDLWRFLLDEEIDRVHATASGGDESAAVSAVSASGVPIDGAFSDASAAVNEIEVYGSDARLRVACYQFDGLEVLPRSAVAGGIGTRVRNLPRLARQLPAAVASSRDGGDLARSYRAEWRSFLAAVAGGEDVACSPREGREAVRVLLAALSSTVTGGPVKVADAPDRPPLEGDDDG